MAEIMSIWHLLFLLAAMVALPLFLPLKIIRAFTLFWFALFACGLGIVMYLATTGSTTRMDVYSLGLISVASLFLFFVYAFFAIKRSRSLAVPRQAE
jgi:hypothetical protein